MPSTGMVQESYRVRIDPAGLVNDHTRGVPGVFSKGDARNVSPDRWLARRVLVSSLRGNCRALQAAQ